MAFLIGIPLIFFFAIGHCRTAACMIHSLLSSGELYQVATVDPFLQCFGCSWLLQLGIPSVLFRSLGGGAGFTQLVDAQPSSPRPHLTDPDRRLPLASAASSAASAASDASASPAAASSVSLRGVVGSGYVQESATVLLAGVQAAWRSRLECARGSGGFSSPAHPAGRHPQLRRRRRPFSTHIAGAAPPGLNLRPPAPILNDPSSGPFLNRPIADSAQFGQPVLLCFQSSPTQANSVRQTLLVSDAGSGSRNAFKSLIAGRAREAGEINKSLLRLGLVINGHVNQRMMESAMIKDLYYEIDGLKQEVFAAREKNGIYIPRERHLQEEVEKKAITDWELIWRLGIRLQLVELKELYDAEQCLSAELGDKLGKTQKDLEDTKSALHDLEEKYNEAKSTIKEKESVIFNLLKSGSLGFLNCACNLRAESIEELRTPNYDELLKSFRESWNRGGAGSRQMET
ncbi:hypothetical protein EJB05_52402 [Eragrostis curvula]|uniref:Uncharacterized protein n=1 Tax=Eragrostis curvula TaxID=38414 RepID=A0A5J9ST40_9POAL|nr:hypothetical protein EJB05_52402 [Eragrostis curvula]